jgi:hypothetical protein
MANDWDFQRRDAYVPTVDSARTCSGRHHETLLLRGSVESAYYQNRYIVCAGGIGEGVSMSRTLAMLREESRLYRQAAAEESAPELKYRLVNHAFALVQLAERIEREEYRPRRRPADKPNRDATG